MKTKLLSFESFASFKYGKMPSKKLFSNNGKYPIFSGYRNVGYCNEYNTEEKTLIVIARGVGGTGDVKLTKEKCYLTNLAISVTINDNVVIPEYLYYYFLLNNLRWLDSGSAQSQITITDLARVLIPIPCITIQKKIVSCLKILDEKIELNNSINKNLEQQAKSLYQEMFLSNPSPEWKEKALSDIADITMGQSPNGESYNENGIGTIFYQGRAEFGDRFPTQRLFTTEPKRMAHENDVLMSVRAPVGDLNIAREDCCIGRGLAAIRSKHNKRSFLLYTLFSIQSKLNVFNGEGTVFGSINRDSLNNIPILVSDAESIAQFESVVAPMDTQIRNNHEENLRLSKLRDTLLPKLMSGEIDVSDINI